MNTADVAVIGAGPCGLFQAFELGLQGIRCDIYDALSEPGGQCTRLYPDKPIYDIPGFPSISARELVDQLLAQAAPFSPQLMLEQTVTMLRPEEELILLETRAGIRAHYKAVVIASGAGAFEPVPLLVPGADRQAGKQLHYRVTDPERFRDRNLVVVGGGDSALDWALTLMPVAASVTLVHRSERFRAQPASVNAVRQACDEMQLQFLAGRVAGLIEQDGTLTGVRVQSTDGVIRRLEADELLVMFGLSPQIGMLRAWGLELTQNQIAVDAARFETSVPGIFAIGDINGYPGKRKLILSGFHEAALAAFAIRERLEPGKPVQLHYTTTSPVMHERLGVAPDIGDLADL